MISELILLFLTCFFILLTISDEFRKYFHAKIYSSVVMSSINDKVCGKWKPIYLSDFKQLTPKEPNEKLRILEVGPARGYNFQVYPENASLVAIDINQGFKNDFMNRIKKYPNIELKAYVTGSMEDMSVVSDNSVDVVLTTYVHCSVKNQKQAMSEVLRVLKPGGKYFFVEHVAFHENKSPDYLWLIVQRICSPFLWALCGGCHVDRKSWTFIEQAGFAEVHLHYAYPWNLPHIIRPHIYGHAIKTENLDDSSSLNDNANNL